MPNVDGSSINSPVSIIDVEWECTPTYKKVWYLDYAGLIRIPYWVKAIATDRNGAIYGFSSEHIYPVHELEDEQWDFIDYLPNNQSILLGQCTFEGDWTQSLQIV